VRDKGCPILASLVFDSCPLSSIGEVMRAPPTRKLRTIFTVITGAALLCAGISKSAQTTPDENSWSGAQSQNADPGLSPSLDFNTFRSSIEPVFLKKRQGNVRCYDCHSVMNTRLRLQPLSAKESTWTEEQSRLNFAVVSRLVTPHEPMKSRLLLHPLALEAGGDRTHTGGKFWASTSDPEWQMIATWVGTANPIAPARENRPADMGSAGFTSYKVNVEPIFLKQRPGHARCYSCHSEGSRAFHLERLSPGRTEWTEEQSQRNFANVIQQVAPGDPTSSRLLMHPLAPESGGEAFHSGGRQFASQNDPDWLKIADWVNSLKSPPARLASARKTRIYITNSAGDTVDVVDPATNKVVQTIQGIELPHGVVFSPDGARVYISNESESVLDVVDGSSGRIVEKVPLSGHPNNLTITKDGKRVLVGIRAGSGSLEVIDTRTLKKIKSIPVSGPVHNVYVTPDGKYAVSGSIDMKTITVVDLQSEQAVWDLNLGSGVRPMAFDVNADGSTNRIFAQLSGFNGFAVISFAKHAEIERIKLPDQPGGYGVAEGRTGTPSHGIGVAPDGASLWIASTAANAIFEYSLPSLELMGHVELPVVHILGLEKPTSSVPEWITFSPDGKFLYLSNSGSRSVSAIDTATRQIVEIIPAGEVPKRINTMVVR
jgi:YVTN family beta-propeller protein